MVSTSMNVSTVGSWSVHKGTVISEEGSTEVTVISDGKTEWHTPEEPAELIIALMTHLGIKNISS